LNRAISIAKPLARRSRADAGDTLPAAGNALVFPLKED
jgi:hypothetical protein